MIYTAAGQPFQAAADNAPPGLVDQITVEVYDPTTNVVIVEPTTAGITEPEPGTYIVTLAVTTVGSYRVRWTLPDGTMAEEQLTTTASEATSYRPSVEELSSLMRARTQGQLSDQGEFNWDTRPTAVQAEEMISVALGIVSARLGDRLPARLVDSARKAVLFKAAALVEVTYYPEQANEDQSAYALYQAQFEELRDVLVSALDDNRPNQSRIASVKTFGRHGYDPDL